MRISRRLIILGSLLAIGLATQGIGQTITWGNDLSSNNLKTSTGSFLDDSFIFEIGTFADLSGGQPGNPLDPAIPAYPTLHEFWKPIDFAFSPPESGWNTTTRTFAGSATIVESAFGSNLGFTDAVSGSTDQFADPDLVPGGEQIFLWIHNGTLHGGGDATEKALFTASFWTTRDFDALSFPLELNLSAVDTSIYGTSLRDGLQTIPEPSVGSFLILAGIALWRIRTR